MNHPLFQKRFLEPHVTAMTELNEQMTRIENQIATLLEKLENQRSLEDSLGEADEGLRAASDSVGRLAESNRATAESLTNILAEFQSAIELLEKADPGRAAEAISELEQQLSTQHDETKEAISAAATRIENRQKVELARVKRIAYFILAAVLLAMLLGLGVFIAGIL